MSHDEEESGKVPKMSSYIWMAPTISTTVTSSTTTAATTTAATSTTTKIQFRIEIYRSGSKRGRLLYRRLHLALMNTCDVISIIITSHHLSHSRSKWIRALTLFTKYDLILSINSIEGSFTNGVTLYILMFLFFVTYSFTFTLL